MTKTQVDSDSSGEPSSTENSNVGGIDSSTVTDTIDVVVNNASQTLPQTSSNTPNSNSTQSTLKQHLQTLHQSQKDLAKLERFKSNFYIFLTVFLYFIFQIVYISLHKNFKIYTFVLLLISTLCNFFLVVMVGTNMKLTPDDIKHPVKHFLTAFVFMNFTSACQFADYVGTEPLVYLTGKELGLFWLNVFLLTILGFVCCFGVIVASSKFLAPRIGKMFKSWRVNKNFWERFYKCCASE